MKVSLLEGRIFYKGFEVFDICQHSANKLKTGLRYGNPLLLFSTKTLKKNETIIICALILAPYITSLHSTNRYIRTNSMQKRYHTLLHTVLKYPLFQQFRVASDIMRGWIFRFYLPVFCPFLALSKPPALSIIGYRYIIKRLDSLRRSVFPKPSCYAKNLVESELYRPYCVTRKRFTYLR